jgi:hypothetical protein
MDIFRIFHLQCARRLPALPESHPCSRKSGVLTMPRHRIGFETPAEPDPLSQPLLARPS